MLEQKLGAKVLPTRSGHPQQNFRSQASHGLNSLERSYSKGEGQWHGIFSVHMCATGVRQEWTHNCF